MEKYTTGTGQNILVHDKEDCGGKHCVIHNPSDHHMKDWPTNWRGDRGLMERICPCGVGHPDPDDLAFKESIGVDVHVEGIHGCCMHFCGESKQIQIEGFTKYFITRDGGIWNNKLERFMTPHEKHNYLYIQLNENGKRIYKSIHRLVAETYIPNPDNKRTVNHLDSDTFNNNVSNLEWATDSENIQHSFDNNRRDNAKIVYANNGKSMCKLTEEDVKKVFEMRSNGIKVKDIAASFSVHRETISRILRGLSYKEFQFSSEEFEV